MNPTDRRRGNGASNADGAVHREIVGVPTVFLGKNNRGKGTGQCTIQKIKSIARLKGRSNVSHNQRAAHRNRWRGQSPILGTGAAIETKYRYTSENHIA